MNPGKDRFILRTGGLWVRNGRLVFPVGKMVSGSSNPIPAFPGGEGDGGEIADCGYGNS